VRGWCGPIDHFFRLGQARLYNLDLEISEMTNLADKHPEVVAKLRVLADTMNAEIGGTAPISRRPAGIAANPRTLYPSEAPKARGTAHRGGTLGSQSLGCIAALHGGFHMRGVTGGRCRQRCEEVDHVAC
jgi:hypothetical protein